MAVFLACCALKSMNPDLLMIGTFSNAQEHGAMAIFTSREAAEAFARDDPFVLHGVVRSWHFIQIDNPALVTQAVHDVLTAVRQHAHLPSCTAAFPPASLGFGGACRAVLAR